MQALVLWLKGFNSELFTMYMRGNTRTSFCTQQVVTIVIQYCDYCYPNIVTIVISILWLFLSQYCDYFFLNIVTIVI